METANQRLVKSLANFNGYPTYRRITAVYQGRNLITAKSIMIGDSYLGKLRVPR